MRKEEALFMKSSREHRHLPGFTGGPRQRVLHTISAICGRRSYFLERVNPHSAPALTWHRISTGDGLIKSYIQLSPEMASLPQGLGSVRMKMDGLGRKLSQSVHDE